MFNNLFKSLLEILLLLLHKIQPPALVSHTFRLINIYYNINKENLLQFM